MSSTATPDLEQLRFPIGRFDPKASFTSHQREQALDSIASTPARMREAVAGLNDEQFDTPYREGGWTVRQVVHHVPDSHMNAYVRFKLALTEDTPLIKTYEEAAWAKLADARDTPIEVSLSLLDALHVRFDKVLRAMSDEDFQRKLQHPEWGDLDLSTMVSLYEWHGRHHVAHIAGLRERNSW
jgi:uncharacterized damage-inducible protein DinB